MKKSEVKLFKRWDIAVFAAVIILALTLFLLGLGKSEGSSVVISINGDEKAYPISSDTSVQIENEGIKLTVTVKDGKAWVSETTCQNAICSHSGKISKDGQMIVCAPAKVSVKIVGKGGDYDAVTG